MNENEIKTLTPRQSQVLICLAEDMGTKQIARKMNVSARTVMAHLIEVKNVFANYTRAGVLGSAIKGGTLRWDEEHQEWYCATRETR